MPNLNGSMNIIDLLLATSLYINVQYHNQSVDAQKKSVQAQSELVELFTDMNNKLSKIISLLEENK